MKKKVLVIVVFIVIFILGVIGIVCLNKNNAENSTNSYIPNGVDSVKLNEEIKSQENIERDPEKVDIKIDDNSISPESVSIVITDKNENHYGWGVEFRVQEKVNGEWKELEYASDDLSWIDIAYELSKDGKMNQKLNIEKYYGKLSKGIYRIVKPVYDKKYVDIYSNEFEIR